MPRLPPAKNNNTNNAHVPMKLILKYVLATALGCAAACGQGFINLDFEQAVVQPLPPDNIFLDWTMAVPGWSHSDGASTSFVYYQQEHLGEQQIFLLMDSTSPVWAPGTQLDGEYSLAFASGVQSTDPASDWVNAFIAQTGDVPGSARSLRLLATGPFQVFLGGKEIVMFSLGDNAYGGDISAFAGSTAELKIVNTASAGDIHYYSVVDDIVFSSEPIPEPTTGLLIWLGGGVLISFRFRRTALEKP